MSKYLVIKKYNNWIRLTYEEKLLKFSHILKQPVTDDDVVNITLAESENKLKPDPFQLSDIGKFNYMLDNTRSLIPMISTTFTDISIEMFINNPTIVYENGHFYRTSGSVNLVGMIIPPTLYTDQNMIDASEYEMIKNKPINFIFDKLKYQFIYHNLYQYYNLHTPIIDIQKYDAGIIDIIRKDYMVIKSDKKLENNDTNIIVLAIDNSLYEKEYDDSLYDEYLISSRNPEYFHIIINLFSLNIFTNQNVLTPVVVMNSLIDMATNVKGELIGKLGNTTDEHANKILTILDSALDYLTIFIVFYKKLKDGVINFDRDHKLYNSYKKHVKVVQTLMKFKQDLLIYVYESLFPNEYKLLKRNKIKIQILMNYIVDNYLNISKLPTKITTNILLGDFRNKYKVSKIMYDDPSVLDEIDKKHKSPLYKQYNIKPLLHEINYNVDNIVIDVNLKKLKIKKVKMLKSGVAKKYDITFDIVGESMKLYEKIKKYIFKISREFLNDLRGLGFMNNRFVDDTIKGITKDEYLSRQFHILNDMLREWNMRHDMNSGKNLYDVLNLYIKNDKDAKEVYEYLRKHIDMYKLIDVSDKSIEYDKIQQQELNENRINVYYNLTPDEKLAIDKFTAWSDEWKEELDARLENYMHASELIKKEQEDELDLAIVDV